MTKIEWTDCTWNPVRGCQIVSPGCTHCYAMRQAHRFSGRGQPYEELTKMSKSGPIWSGKVRLVPEVLDAPLHWRKPRRIFVNSMSDLFHEDVPDEFIDRVFAVMMLADWHRYQILTKRHERMRDYFDVQTEQRVYQSAVEIALGRGENPNAPNWDIWWEWPAPWIWLGVSCEDQKTADERIPMLLQTPAAVRFVSCEPLLSRVSLLEFLYTNLQATAETRTRNGRRQMKLTHEGLRGDLHWVILGGESGPKARPCDIAWMRSIVRQCKAASVPVFVKQLGAKPFSDGDRITYRGRRGGPQGFSRYLNDHKGGDPAEWPIDVSVREWPR